MFEDFNSAFDLVKQQRMPEAQRECRVEYRYIVVFVIVRNIYENATACIRVHMKIGTFEGPVAEWYKERDRTPIR